MIFSYNIKHNIDPKLEDAKTSTIFENLLNFPDELLWQVLYNAIYDNKSITKKVGKLESYEFWPKWDNKGTSNSSYVEPDLFLQFENLDVIIEAKRSEDAGQYADEWRRELRAYHNEYPIANRNPILIAVGGNNTLAHEIINVRDFGEHCIYRCSWLSLLTSVIGIKDNYETTLQPQLQRLCATLELGFQMHDVQFFKWMDNGMNFSHINPISRHALELYFADSRKSQNKFKMLLYKHINKTSLTTLQSFFNGTN